jgi:hypothetical protein
VHSSHLDDPEYWRKRAQEMRELAASVGLVDAQAELLAAASDYDHLAERAEDRSKNAPWPPR